MHNIHRGEITINFPSQTLTLRPSFQALCEIESVLGKSIIKVLIEFEQEQLQLVEIMAIIKAGAKAYDGTVLTEEKMSMLIEEKGLLNLMPDIVKFLVTAIGLEKEKL